MSHPPLTLFCLHYLGGSGRSFAPLREALGGDIVLAPVDLPGFGDAYADAGYRVQEMADRVALQVGAAKPARWGLLGHSMGAKVAMALTSRIESDYPLAQPEFLALVAGSPPSPEPLTPVKREQMLSWFRGDSARTRTEALTYLRQNVSTDLAAPLRDMAMHDLERMNPAAWAAWLQSGSREDWSSRVGTLRTPALLIAGEHDDSLGEKAQRALMAPHLAVWTLHVIPHCSHLLPLEAPNEVAELIASAQCGPIR